MSSLRYNGVNLTGSLRVAVIVSAIVFSAALFVFAATPARAATANVAISDNNPTLFTPQVLTVNVGDTVVWTCNDGAHSTTSNMGQAESWDSGTLNEGATFSHIFTTTGNFSYFSTASSDAGSVGYIVVQQPAPEFPGLMLFMTVAAAVILAFLVERRLRA